MCILAISKCSKTSVTRTRPHTKAKLLVQEYEKKDFVAKGIMTLKINDVHREVLISLNTVINKVQISVLYALQCGNLRVGTG